MTSRERVRLAMRHKEPDRIPVDLWGTDSRIHTDLYLRIMEKLGKKEFGERIRPGSTCEYEDYSLADLIGSDFRHINIGRPDSFKSYIDGDGNSIDEWGVGRKIIGMHPSITKYPLANAKIEQLEAYKWPDMLDSGRVRGLAERARNWYETTDCAITATSATSGTIFEICQFLYGIEDFLVCLYDDPDFAAALIEKVTDLIIELNVLYVRSVAPYIEWIEFASDFGTQSGPFISPDCFREFFLRPHKRLFDAVKEAAPGVKIFLHSCGGVRPLIPMFIESGVDILSSIQPLAAGMDSFELKAEFGGSLVFHGGIDIQNAAPGTLDRLHEECKTRIKAFGQGGGYIFSPSNHFIEDVPVENFFKMYEYAKELGKYPLS